MKDREKGGENEREKRKKEKRWEEKKRNILGNLQREWEKGRDKIKLKKNDNINKEKETDTKLVHKIKQIKKN